MGFEQVQGLSIDKWRSSRKFRYMSDLKTMMKFNDFSFHDWKDDEETREKVRSILAQIERSDYRNGDKEYAPKTKQSYFNTVKRVIESHDIDPENTELLPQNWSPNTSETEASNIRPGDLPSPEEMKKLLANPASSCGIPLSSFCCGTQELVSEKQTV